MSRRAILLLPCLCAVWACGGPPPPLQPVDTAGIRIVAVGEDGDEWLHTRCKFRGIAVASDDQSALVGAKLAHANVVEPLLRSSSSSSNTVGNVTTTTSSASYTVARFACKTPVPAQLVLR